ncbi:PP2AA2 [Symbiodinium natans]|uniref:PP2AA2 protein n=1 Tax=Symbiodinium natans TaxID=878477 RepID=A0A812I5B8_9DINO|nr:PP2AA2 [Symbiodinium natans]
MLRTFTNAALEHSRSLDLDSDSETEHTDDEHSRPLSFCRRIGICIGYLLPTWGHLSLANVGRSWAAGALALWHCFLILAASCLIFCNCASVVLRSYIIWYTKLDTATATSPEGRFHLMTLFYGAFFRSYIMQSATTDVLRFAFILCKDAWRPDVFEAYRRLLVGDAWGELEAGEFYICSWSRLTKHQTWLDIFFQMLLHVSLDLIPLIYFVRAQRSGTHSEWTYWAEVCLLTGIIHVFVFYFLWWMGEVSLKVKYFCRAWRQARAFTGLRHGRSSAMHMTHSIWVLHDETQFDSQEQEHRSICVTTCTLFHWGEYLFPMMICIFAFVFGLMDGRTTLAMIGGCSALMSWIVMVVSSFADRIQPLNPPRWFANAFNHPDILQRWGEKWCRLNHSAQKRQRHPFAITLIVVGAVFGAARLKWLTLSCLAILFLLFLRLLSMYFEGAWGWATAFLEAIFEGVILQWLVIQTADRPLLDSFLILLLCAMRQFGFQREVRAGDRIRVVSFMALGVNHLVIIFIVCWAFVTLFQSDEWSSFCPNIPDCKYQTIPPRPGLESYTPLCNMEFPTKVGKYLKFADFGLFASLTYEPRSRVEAALHHYFPKWHLDEVFWRIERTRPHGDWSRFLMFTSEDNGTTVIAVRGTLDAVDVLQDFSLWMLPAILQTIGLVGPDIGADCWGVAMARHSNEFPLCSVNLQRTYASLLQVVTDMLATYPNRTFYLTGHSLGGGVAKLVDLELTVRRLAKRPTTIAFSAPGLLLASQVLYSGHVSSLQEFGSALSSISIKPSGDIVSSVDIELGSRIAAPCTGFALQCHSIYSTLWHIFSLCGSAATSENVSIPCSWPTFDFSSRMEWERTIETYVTKRSESICGRSDY